MPEWIARNEDGSSVVRADDGREIPMPTHVAEQLAAEGAFAPLAQAPPMGAPVIAQETAGTALVQEPGGGQYLTSPELAQQQGAMRPAPPAEPQPPPVQQMLAPEDNPEIFGRPMEQPAQQERPAQEADEYRFFEARQQQAPQAPQYATVSTSNTQRSTSSVLGADELIGEQQEAAQVEAGALREQAGVEQELSEKLAGVNLMQADAAEKADAAIKSTLTKRDKALGQRFEEMESLRADLKQAVEDGDRSYWADQSTAGQVMGVLAAAIGGAAQAYIGGPNNALQHINRLMEADFRSKQANVRNRQDLVRGQYDLIDATRAVAEDETQAALLTKSIQLEQLASTAEAFKASAQGDAAKARADQLAAGLRKELVQTKIALAPKQTTQSTTTSKRVPVMDPAQQQGQMQAEFPGGTVVNPQLWSQLRDVDKQAARNAASAYRDVISTTRAMEQLRQEYGTEAAATEAAQRYKALQLQLVGAMTTLMNSGVLNEGEYERYAKATGGDLSPKWSDAQRIFTLGGVDPTLNAVRGFRQAIEAKASRVGPDSWGVDITTGAPQVTGQQQGVALE